MSLFVCDECGSVDNTALTNFWLRKQENVEGRALCSACGPRGRWHGCFPREQWDGERQVINRGQGGPMEVGRRREG